MTEEATEREESLSSQRDRADKRQTMAYIQTSRAVGCKAATEKYPG
jgi:hypothetical protein